MPADKSRALRADARENEQRLLDAAARAFARDGKEASLKAIAKDAGVGIGTLYRRFPTRERLVEAAYRNEVAKLCAAAPELLASRAALEALRSWMDRFLDFMATKHAMGDALRAVLLSDDDRMAVRGMLTDALATLLTATAADDATRADIAPRDVLMALGGVSLIAGEERRRDLGNRLLDLLVDGLRFRPPDAPQTTKLRLSSS